MNFDKENFSKILIKIKDSYGSINQMAEKTGITSAYISKLIRLMYDNAPSPDILWKLSSNSNGIVTYFDLMEICGYIKEQDINIEVYSSKIFQNIISFFDSQDIVKDILNNFIIYTNDLKDSLVFKNGSIVKEISYYINFKIDILKPFFMLHNAFVQLLLNRKKISKDYANIYIQDSTVYDNTLDMNNDFSIRLFRYDSNMKLQNKNIQEIIDLLWLYSITIRYSYLSHFSNNQENLLENTQEYSSQFYMCPVYGQISAGQPNWAEENIEGRIPIDTNLMDIVSPEEHFFLRVNGESMNKVVKNGAFALIHKQDTVENGEIAVVLVNGFDATIKKFTKQGDLIILEPQSSDETFKTQVYDKDTSIKILGKYVGKMEINK